MGRMSRLVQSNPASSLSNDELESTLVRGTAEQSAHLAAWLTALAEFDRRELWQSAGFHTCAAWLTARCGSSSRSARDHVQVAQRLESLPATRAAFAEGRVSFSKVRALCRVAEPESEEFLLGLAMDLTASQLERHLRSYESSQRGWTNEDELRRRARTGVTTWFDADGMRHDEIVSPPEDGLLIGRIIEFGMEQRYKEQRASDKAARAEGRDPEVRPTLPASERRYEGLLWVLRRGLINAERDPSPVPLDDPFLIVFHVREGAAFVEDSGDVNLGNGLSVSPAVLQRLCCTSMIQAMLMGDDGRRPLDLGRSKRLADDKQKLALSALFDGCEFPGCEVPIRWCQFHHLEHWGRDLGKSDLSNFRPLCRRHHSLAHEGGWELVLGHRGDLVAISPNGRRFDSSQMLTDEAVSREAMIASLADLGFDFDDPDRASTIAGRWGGERIDAWARAEIGSAIADACGQPPIGSTPAEPGGAPLRR